MKKYLLPLLMILLYLGSAGQTRITLKDYTKYEGLIIDSNEHKVHILLDGRKRPTEFYRSDILFIDNLDSLKAREQARASAGYQASKKFTDSIPDSAPSYKRVVYHGFIDVKIAGKLGLSGMLIGLVGSGLAISGAVFNRKELMYTGCVVAGVSIPLFISSFSFLISAGSMPAPRNDSWKTKW